MEKAIVIGLIISLSLMMMIMPMVDALDKSPKAVEQWFQKLPHAKQKTTKLHFYFHDIADGGANETAPIIAQANITSLSPFLFGILRMIDDPLTVGPELSSKRIGSAQGIYGSAAMDEFGLLMNLNFVFTQGPYKGSTLSLLGRNAIGQQYREMPIVGGSGLFRLARGIATAKTYFANFTLAIVEYHLIVLHY
ncbi:dirigent protein 23-like [Lycium barbarum]|nr:dirigent protein 23-like [Lycium barbarum]